MAEYYTSKIKYINVRDPIFEPRKPGEYPVQPIDQVISALERLNNYCEEIDYHLPIEEQTGYQMFPDYMIIWQYLMSIKTKITHCEDCVYWNDGSCNCPNIVVNCQDYYVGDIQTSADDFCSYAERRDN